MSDCAIYLQFKKSSIVALKASLRTKGIRLAESPYLADIILMHADHSCRKNRQITSLVRQMRPQTIILQFTHQQDEIWRCRLYREGADQVLDYPMDEREIVCRIQAWQRHLEAIRKQAKIAVHSPIAAPISYRLEDVELNGPYLKLGTNPKEFRLSRQQINIAQYLLQQNAKPVLKQKLVESLYGEDHISHRRSVTVMLTAIRKLIHEHSTMELITHRRRYYYWEKKKLLKGSTHNPLAQGAQRI